MIKRGLYYLPFVLIIFILIHATILRSGEPIDSNTESLDSLSEPIDEISEPVQSDVKPTESVDGVINSDEIGQGLQDTNEPQAVTEIQNNGPEPPLGDREAEGKVIGEE